MTDRHQLITALGAELTPVPWWRRPRPLTWLWVTTSIAFVVLASLLVDPWRPGFGRQLLAAPRFGLEIALATAGFLVLAVAGFRSVVPAAIRPSRAAALGLLAFLPWLALLVWGLWQPALEPSMVGKRAACYLEVLALGTPPLAAALFLCRSLFPMSGWVTGALAGAASGMIPGIAMQMACMYVVPHALTHHVLPVAATMSVGAVAGALILRTR